MNTDNRTASSESVVFKFRIFDVVERSYPGRSGAVQRRHIVKHPGAVGIIPILPDGRVLLISQFRISFQKVIYEIPAGTREAGEDPSKTAERELIEETGYRAGRLELLQPIYTSPGVLQEELFLFLGTDLIPGKDAPEDGELISLVPKTWSEIDEMIDKGEILDSKTLSGLFLARRKLSV